MFGVFIESKYKEQTGPVSISLHFFQSFPTSPLFSLASPPALPAGDMMNMQMSAREFLPSSNELPPLWPDYA